MSIIPLPLFPAIVNSLYKGTRAYSTNPHQMSTFNIGYDMFVMALFLSFIIYPRLHHSFWQDI